MNIPYTVERRADTGVTNVTMGIWLFLASEVMLFGALFSSYALLRVAAADWPAGPSILSPAFGLTHTIVLLLMTAAAWRARGAASARDVRRWLSISTTLALVFLAVKAVEYQGEIARGLVPSVSTFLAIYYVLTGLHAAHVAGGVVAHLWIMAGAARVGDAMTLGRIRAATLYWAFVDVVWVAILASMYLT